MALEVRVHDIEESALPAVRYRWDADTDILSVALASAGVSEGLSGSVDIEGRDGSWLMLEVSGGNLSAIEVAVWPEVRTMEPLTPPTPTGAARIHVPSNASQPGLAAVEVDTGILAAADLAESTIHFRIGPRRSSRALQVGRDLLMEIDARSRIAGLWLLNVPPFPGSPDAGVAAPS